MPVRVRIPLVLFAVLSCLARICPLGAEEIIAKKVIAVGDTVQVLQEGEVKEVPMTSMPSLINWVGSNLAVSATGFGIWDGSSYTAFIPSSRNVPEGYTPSVALNSDGNPPENPQVSGFSAMKYLNDGRFGVLASVDDASTEQLESLGNFLGVASTQGYESYINDGFITIGDFLWGNDGSAVLRRSGDSQYPTSWIFPGGTELDFPLAGDSAEELRPGSTHDNFGILENLFDDRSMFVRGGLTLAEGGAQAALFRITPEGQYEVLLVSRDPAPEIDGLAPSFFSIAGGPDMNESREVAFRAVLRDANQIGLNSGVFRMSPDADEEKHYLPVPIVLTGVDYQIGTSNTISFSSMANADVHISESGDVYFEAVEEGNPGNSSTVWRALAENGALVRVGPSVGSPIPGYGFSRVTSTGIVTMGKSGRLLIKINGWYREEENGSEVFFVGYFFQNEFGVFSPAAVIGMPITPGGGTVTNVGEGTFAFENQFQISDTNSLAMVLRVDNVPSVYVFRNASEVEPVGDNYVWDGGAGTDNWHTVVNGRSNWTDSTGVPWPTPPPPDAEVTISSGAVVKLTQEEVTVKTITLDDATLEVNLPSVLVGGGESQLQKLTFDSFLRVPEGSSLHLVEGEINSLTGFLEFEKPDALGPGGTFVKSGATEAAISVAILKLLNAEFTIEEGTLSVSNGESWINGTSINQTKGPTNGSNLFADEKTFFRGTAPGAKVLGGSLAITSGEIFYESDVVFDAVNSDSSIILGNSNDGAPIAFVGGTMEDKRSLELKGNGIIELKRRFELLSSDSFVNNTPAIQSGDGVVVDLPTGKVINVSGDFTNNGRLTIKRGGLVGNVVNEGHLIVRADSSNEIVTLQCENNDLINLHSNVRYSGRIENKALSTFNLYGANLEPEDFGDVLIFNEKSTLSAEVGNNTIQFSTAEETRLSSTVFVNDSARLELLKSTMIGGVEIEISEATGELVLEDTVFEKLFITGEGNAVFRKELRATKPGGLESRDLKVFVNDSSPYKLDAAFFLNTRRFRFEDAELRGGQDGDNFLTVFNIGEYRTNELQQRELLPSIGTLSGLDLQARADLIFLRSSQTTVEGPVVINGPGGKISNLGSMVLKANILESGTGIESSFDVGFARTFSGVLEIPSELNETIVIEPQFGVSPYSRVIVRDQSQLIIRRYESALKDESFMEDGNLVEVYTLFDGLYTIGDQASLLFMAENESVETLKPISKIFYRTILELGAPPDSLPSINGFPARNAPLEISGELFLVDTFLEMNGAEVVNKYRAALQNSEIRGDFINLGAAIGLEERGQEAVVALNNAAIVGQFTNSSIVEVGQSPGTAVVNGDYVMEESGELRIEFAGTEVGTEYDQLEVTGTAALDGKLVLSFLDGYEPNGGEQFEFLVAPTITGDFAEVDQSRLGRDLRFDFAVGSTGMMATAMEISIASYSDWRAVFFTAPDAANDGVSGIGRDPDGDRFTNLAEYALGGNPNVLEPDLIEYAIQDSATPDENLTSISFNWVNDVDDATWSIDRSSDLENWEPLDVEDITMEPNGDSTRISGAQLRPINSEEDLFLRVQIVEAAQP